MKKVFIIYGPPGAGKGTQANLLVGKLGLIHFDTGKFIEQIVHDSANKNDREIQRERKNFDSGILCTPNWVLKTVKEKTEEIAKSGFGIVFSASPRTIFEAFGDKKTGGLFQIFERLYKKKNIIPLLLKIDPHKSVLRNAKRRVCSVCAIPILYNDETHAHITCPLCGGKLRTRTLDDPKILGTRIKEYEERTEPILKGLKKRGYKILEVDGTPLPYKVFESILKKLKLS